MSEGREVSAAEFRDAMAPTVAALNALAGAVEAALGSHAGLPDEESDAMKELASEGEYSASGWKNPITDTHGFWLNERGIAYGERVKRGLCEVIYSRSEVKKLGLTDDADAALAEAKQWAESFGWAVTFPYGKPEVDGTKRRSVPEGIRRLLVADEEAKLGRALWSRLSAVTHVTWWGLQWALDIPDEPTGDGFATIGVGTDSSRVFLQALCIMKALRVAATERFALMGWVGDAEWDAARQAAETHELVLAEVLAPQR